MADKLQFPPFFIQCFLTAGVGINIAQFGLVAAYVMTIVPQLRLPGAEITMSVEASSWFASLHAMALIVGSITIVMVMNRYGRWVSNVCSAGLMFAGWTLVLVADSVTCLLVGRFLKGVSLGLIVALGPIILGECTSPKYRGSFLACTTALMSMGTAFIHYIGFSLHWRTVALICTVISFINVIISIYSPESPSWLATKGRYDECRKTFRQLRGPYEEEELQKLIQASMEIETVIKTENAVSILQLMKNTKDHMISIIKKREVYMPLIIVIHLQNLSYWSGLPVLSSFPDDIIRRVSGNYYNIPLLIMTLDFNRLVTNTSATYVVKKFKRKNMLLVTVGFNAALFFVIAGYAYAKERNLLAFDHPIIGVLLLHALMFSIAIGALPLTMIIAGETSPLEFRSIVSSTSTTVASISLFLCYKTFPQMLENLNISGSFFIYGVIVAYCLIVVYYFIIETKDKTLQEIEDEFKGKSSKSKQIVEGLLKCSDRETSEYTEIKSY